jgi:hypothetical protein
MVDLMSADLTLNWGVKRSLLEYVNDVDGEILIEAPAHQPESGLFSFPVHSSETVGDSRVLTFIGAVRITAHGGLMSIPINAPRLELSGQMGTLSVTSDSGASLLMVELRKSETDDEDKGDLWVASLSPQGAPLFGGVYHAGTEMDSLRLTV